MFSSFTTTSFQVTFTFIGLFIRTTNFRPTSAWWTTFV